MHNDLLELFKEKTFGAIQLIIQDTVKVACISKSVDCYLKLKNTILYYRLYGCREAVD